MNKHTTVCECFSSLENVGGEILDEISFRIFLISQPLQYEYEITAFGLSSWLFVQVQWPLVQKWLQETMCLDAMAMSSDAVATGTIYWSERRADVRIGADAAAHFSCK